MFDVIRSVPLLQKLVEKIPGDFPLRSVFYKRLGDLLSLTGDPEKAMTPTTKRKSCLGRCMMTLDLQTFCDPEATC